MNKKKPNRVHTDHAERSKAGTGASDAGAYMGSNRNKSLYDFVALAIGIKEPVDLSKNPAVQRGVFYEDAVIKYVSHMEGFKIKKSYVTHWHKKLSFMYCHIDGQHNAFRDIDEVKVISSYNSAKLFGKELTDEVPLNYKHQCFHIMACIPKAERVHLWADLPGKGVNHYIIERDEAAIKAIETAAWVAWEYINSKVLPPPVTTSDLKQAFPEDNGETVKAPTFIEVKAEIIQKLREEKKALDKREEEIKNELRAFMKEHSVLKTEDGYTIATWKQNSKGTRTLKVS